MLKTLTYVIETTSQPTISQFLLDQGISKKAISTMKLQDKAILVNNLPCFTIHHLQKGDILKIAIDENSNDENIIPTKMDLNILYEDEDLIILDKPYNLTVHPSKKYFTNTLSNGLAYYYQNQGKDICTHCITRLDKDTSGLTLFAKNRISANYLSKMISEKKIEKTYYALVAGQFDSDFGTIEAPIARVCKGNILRTIDPNGKKAITHYKVIKYNEKNDISLVECKLETGRTHQIRVHLKYLSHPIIGDDLYNKTDKRLNRQALHCGKLSFIHPLSNKLIEVKSQLPNDMACLI